MSIAQELIDKARKEGVSLAGPGGLLSQITKTVLETALNAGMDEHPGYSKGRTAGPWRRESSSSACMRRD